jgi:hypothetical protein
MKYAKLALTLSILLVATFVFSNSWLSAQGPPVADFPSFIPLDILEMPESVAVDKVGNVYASISLFPFGPIPVSDKILKFTPSGERSMYFDFFDYDNASTGGGAFGLAVNASGSIYMVRTTSPYKGVYHVDRHGNAHLLPGTDQINSPNELAFDQRGNLYITDINDPSLPGDCGQGGIWRFPKWGGDAEPWLYDELLTGNCPGYLGGAAGANGIAFYNGDLYVTNPDKSLIVRVPVLPDGSPGPPELWANIEPVIESPFYLEDQAFGEGIAMDVHGNAYVATLNHCAVVRINAEERTQETIALFSFDMGDPLYAPLDWPVGLNFGTGKGGRTILFVANLGWLKLLGYPAPGPGITKIDVGIPGAPLP